MITLKGQVAEMIRAWLARSVRETAISELSELPVSIGSTIGNVRKENQDRVIVVRYTPQAESAFVLLAISDGVGGMVDGAKCAEITLATIVESLVTESRHDPAERLIAAIKAANMEIYQRYRERGGTTIAALLFSNGITGVTVGDSRIYTHVASVGLSQVSVDDSIAGELSRLDIGDRGESDSFSKSLTQFVGMGEAIHPRTYRANPIAAGSGHYLLTTDGVHSVAQETMAQIIASAPNDYEVVSRLINLSRWCGGDDNATLISASAEIAYKNRIGLSRPGILEIWDSAAKLNLFLEVIHQEYMRFSPIQSQTFPPVQESTMTIKFEKGKHVLGNREKPARSKSRSSQKKTKPTKKQTEQDFQQPLNITIIDVDQHHKD